MRTLLDLSIQAMNAYLDHPLVSACHGVFVSSYPESTEGVQDGMSVVEDSISIVSEYSDQLCEAADRAGVV
jgi:hypothetical protein